MTKKMLEVAMLVPPLVLALDAGVASAQSDADPAMDCGLGCGDYTPEPRIAPELVIGTGIAVVGVSAIVVAALHENHRNHNGGSTSRGWFVAGVLVGVLDVLAGLALAALSLGLDEPSGFLVGSSIASAALGGMTLAFAFGSPREIARAP